MSDKPIRVLLIDDDPLYASLVREMLTAVRGAAFEIEYAETLSAGLDRLAAGGVDVLLLDLSLKDSWGFDTFARAQSQARNVPLIVLTCLDDQATAMKAISRGAQDYLVKDTIDGSSLARAIHYAIERKRVEATLTQQYHEMALLNQAIRAFNSTLDPSTVLASVLEETRRLLGVVACSVWLIEPGTGDLICRQATGHKSEIVVGWRLEPGDGLAGWVARTGESLVVADATADERHFGGVDQQTGLEMRSILSVPLRVRDRIIGVLQVLDTQPDRFSTADLTLLETLAASAAVAIENARLYEEADRLRAFNENIVQSMEEGILLEDTTGHIAFVNAKTARLLGYDPQELIGQHRMTIIAPQHLVAFEEESVRRRQGIAGRYEMDLLTKQGEQVHVLVSSQPLFNDGRFAGILSVFVDIPALGEGES